MGKVSKLLRVWNNCGAVEVACERCDWSWIAGWIYGKWGCEVTPEWVFANRPEVVKLGGSPVWSDGSWAMYWKTQVIKSHVRWGKEPVRHPLTVPFDKAATATLHVFFISLEETEEMIFRLRNDRSPAKSGPATPGIERVMTRPEPIDRTAARVFGSHD